MHERFYFDNEIDITKIHDSMQLDSEQMIAELRTDDYIASLEVRGEVRVYWDGSETSFKNPSKFPQELKELIANNRQWMGNPRVYVSENNWFEVFIFNSDYEYLDSYVVDVDGMTSEEIKDMLKERIKEYINKEV